MFHIIRAAFRRISVAACIFISHIIIKERFCHNPNIVTLLNLLSFINTPYCALFIPFMLVYGKAIYLIAFLTNYKGKRHLITPLVNELFQRILAMLWYFYLTNVFWHPSCFIVYYLRIKNFSSKVLIRAWHKVWENSNLKPFIQFGVKSFCCILMPLIPRRRLTMFADTLFTNRNVKLKWLL